MPVVSKMDFLFIVVFFSLGLHMAWCSVNTYKAAYMREDVKLTIDQYPRLIIEAAKMNADVVILPSSELVQSEKMSIYDADTNNEIIKSISNASKKGKLYVVAHLLEKMYCQDKQEIIRNNLVFDREGTIVAIYRKPLHGSAKCNVTNTVAGTFTTDFGVTFALLMEEDLVLKNVKNMNGLKNFALAGTSTTNIPYLSASEFSSSWSYATNANLLSSKGIFVGRAGMKTGSGAIVVVDLLKDDDQSAINFSGLKRFTNLPGEDLSQSTIKPLDIEASSYGYHETVCQDTFCCDFHLKTSFLRDPKEVNYGLVAFSGVRHFDHQSSIGVQSCTLLACAGLYKRSCILSTVNTTNIVFDEVSISGKFTKDSAQFPIMQFSTETTVESKNFNMNEISTDDQNHVIARLCNATDVLRFGIFGRDYGKDFEIESYQDRNKTAVSFEYTDYIYCEHVEEFFDYLWIRLRIVIVVVSIYILEMI